MPLTSDNDPIRVDFVDPAAHGVSGRLGLTLAPGKRTPGVSADWDRDLGKDLARLRKHYRTDVLVTLIEEFEMEDVGIQQLRPEARRAGMRSIWFPIADLSTPRHPADPIALVREITGHLAAGETVVVHCMGGRGRAGTIAACVLAARGVEPARSIALVRAVRPGALETPAQEAFVSRFQTAWREAGGS